jgi:hypothetical protein
VLPTFLHAIFTNAVASVGLPAISNSTAIESGVAASAAGELLADRESLTSPSRRADP